MAGLIPSAGQYVLAHAEGSDAPLATALFAARILPDGFIAAPPIPSTWGLGTQLHMRGPLGNGFRMPASARRIALVALKSPTINVLSLLDAALRQEGLVTLVASEFPDDLPLQVEAQPIHALHDVSRWADYVAFDVPREALPELKEMMQAERTSIRAEAQVLVHTPMPCGALAACGVCSVDAGGKALLACEDGPVFDLRQLMGWSTRA